LKKVFFNKFTIYLTCSYIPPTADETVYDTHLNALNIFSFSHWFALCLGWF